MKVPRSDEILVAVRPQWMEVAPDACDLYNGIYLVILNEFVEVAFIPAFPRTAWPPPVPADVDDVKTVQQARSLTALLTPYTVTPGDEAPATQIFATEDGSGVLFVTTPGAFQTFQGELAALADERPGIHDRWRACEIMDLEATRFLMETVVGSPAFDPCDVERLWI